MTYSQSNWNDLNTTFPLSDIIAYWYSKTFFFEWTWKIGGFVLK
jgi:hypothetical protein